MDEDEIVIVFTGTPYSGTRFTAIVHTAGGVPTGHECVYTLGPCWRPPTPEPLVAESSWLAVPYMRKPECREKVKELVRVVRNPLDTIRSLVFRPMSEEYMGFVKEHLQVSDIRTPDGAAEFVAGWHEMLSECKPDRMFRVEDPVPWIPEESLDRRCNAHADPSAPRVLLSEIDRKIRPRIEVLLEEWGY